MKKSNFDIDACSSHAEAYIDKKGQLFIRNAVCKIVDKRMHHERVELGTTEILREESTGERMSDLANQMNQLLLGSLECQNLCSSKAKPDRIKAILLKGSDADPQKLLFLPLKDEVTKTPIIVNAKYNSQNDNYFESWSYTINRRNHELSWDYPNLPVLSKISKQFTE